MKSDNLTPEQIVQLFDEIDQFIIGDVVIFKGKNSSWKFNRLSVESKVEKVPNPIKCNTVVHALKVASKYNNKIKGIMEK